MAEAFDAFGKLDDKRSLLGYAVGHFFDNGGTDAFVLRIVGDNGGAIMPSDPAFMHTLNAAFVPGSPIGKIETFNLICVPGLADAAAVAMLQAKAVARGAFLIVDCEESATIAGFPAALAALTGANAVSMAGTNASTCNNWSPGSLGTAIGGIDALSDAPGWWAGRTLMCSQNWRVYCVER